ncbi:MAG: TetR/AcrR family transcriptional regulator, partial [Pseudomonadota bacterium]
ELFRRFGYKGVGIDKIMNDAGLTRGGFYAHFKSKAHLFQKVIGEELNFTKQVRKLRDGPVGGVQNRALFAIRHYLGPKTRDHIGGACTMASSAIDVAGSDTQTRAAFEARVKDLLGEITDLFDEDGVTLNAPQAQAILAMSVGGLVLARACNEPTATEILDASYNAIEKMV